MSEALQRKIYEAIDARNYKAALKLCDKGKKSALIGALKALTLQRLGRRDEANAQCSTLMALKPPITDGTVLSPLTMALDALGQQDDALGCWERAFATKADEDFGREVFHYCARRFDLEKQRTAAMRLYKATQQSSYLLWFAAAALAESRCRKGDHSKMLVLAERMAVKACTDLRGSIGAASSEEQELLTGLRRQAGTSVVEVLRAAITYLAEHPSQASENGVRRSNPGDLALLEAQELHGEDDARAAYEEILKSGNLDWVVIKGYADASSDRDAAIKFLSSLGGPKDRGPKLGVLSLLSSDVDRLRTAILQYADTFGESRSCFDDLEASLRVLRCDFKDDTIASVFSDRLRADFDIIKEKSAAIDCTADDDDETLDETVIAEALPESDPKILAALRRFATSAKCLRFVGGGDDAKILCEASSMAWDLGEVDVADDVGCLAYEVVRDAVLSSQEEEYRWPLLVEAATIVEWTRQRSPKNATLVLAAVEGLDAIGAGEAGLRLNGGLGIKQIQLESLGWILFPWCSRAGFFQETRHHCKHIQSLHRSARTDAGEYSFRALQNEKYARAVELVEFQLTEMDPSLQLALADAEMRRLGLLLDAHTVADANDVLSPKGSDFDDLVVNADLFVRPSWRERSRGDVAVDKVTASFGAILRDYYRVARLEHQILAAIAAREPVENLVQSLQAALPSFDFDDFDDDILRTTIDAAVGRRSGHASWLAHPWAKPIWNLALRSYEAVGESSEPAAVAELTAVREDVSQLGTLIFPIPTVPLSRRWIAGVADALQHALAPLVLVLQVLAPQPSKQQRGKKKKGSNAPESDGQQKPAIAALHATAQTAATFFNNLDAALNDARDRLHSLLDDNKNGEIFPPPPLGALPADVATPLRDDLWTRLCSGQILAVDRLLEVVGPKRSALRLLVPSR